jgi:3-oxoacyl-[acyl-carrier protein] reductase
MPLPLHPDLTGRIALVTGASRGIGAAIALSLADAGASIAVNYRERATEADAVARAITAIGRRAVTVPADVSDSAAVAAMIRAVAANLGPIDILNNNAGVGLIRGIDDLTEADFDQTIAVT